MIKLKNFPCDQSETLEPLGSWPRAGHYYDSEHMKAVVAAWHARRPLLVKGEPGVGKSQLARAVVHALGCQFISVAIQPRSEYQELLWKFDAVERLAQAQLLGALGAEAAKEEMQKGQLPESLCEEKFIIPGPLWWAVRPKSAEAQTKICGRKTSPLLGTKSEKNPELAVLLIDEIDKADANLPNGLLEFLGNGDLNLPTLPETAKSETPNHPLTIITSNDERQLPPAFERRCLVLNIKLPKDELPLVAHLKRLATSHQEMKKDGIQFVTDKVIQAAAKLLYEVRVQTPNDQRPPGAAEFLDLLRAVGGIADVGGDDEKTMIDRLTELQNIVLLKKRKT